MVMPTIIVAINVANDCFWRTDRQSSDVALYDYITSTDFNRRHLPIPISMIYFSSVSYRKIPKVFLFLKIDICHGNGRKRTIADDNRQSTWRKNLLGICFRNCVFFQKLCQYKTADTIYIAGQCNNNQITILK